MKRYKKIKLQDGSTIDEHRLIMQNHLCRILSRHEVVHHKDGNKRNNVLTNLELLDISEHSKLHMIGWNTKDGAKSIMANMRKSQRELFVDNEKWVCEVKAMLASGIKQSKIAFKLGKSKYAISRIARGISYSWL